MSADAPTPARRVLHEWRARGRLRRLTVAGVVVLAAVLSSACARPAPKRPAPSPSAATTQAPVAVRSGIPAPVPGKVMVGSYVNLKGMSEAKSLDLRRKQLGREPRILHRYYGWKDPLPQAPEKLPEGSILLISWDGVPYASVTNGSQDALIRKAADAMVKYREPVFLRWAWEMNGDWYSWGGARNGKNPKGFVAAWRHIHDIFRERGVTNVAWVWAPNCYSGPQEPWNDMTAYYPGDEYVDWVGVSGYPWTRETPEDLFRDVYDNYGARKPIMIAETGMLERGGTVKADWIAALQSWIAAHPSVAALVWFDTDNDKNDGKNWRIDSTPSSLAAYKRLTDDPRFQG